MIIIEIKFYIAVIFLIIIVIYVYFEVTVFKINKISIKQDKLLLKNRFKIIQISDYHNNKLINKKRLIEAITNLNPDIIVLTGDMIDKKTDNFDNVLDLLNDLKRINENTYTVSGNHEMNNKNIELYEKKLETIGIYNLDYKNVILNIREDKINLCGIPFKSSNEEEVVFEKFSDELFTILLSHSPNKALKIKSFKSDLILSGHTHGGQIRLPFIGAILTSEEGFSTTYSKGLYDLDYGKLYIDSGLGNSVKPIRTFNRVQISLIEIE